MQELKIIAKYTIVIFLLCLSSFSFAEQSDWDIIANAFEESVNEVVEERTTVTLHVGGWSYQLNDYARNEDTQLYALEYRHWLAGTFVNSFYDRTWLVGYNWVYKIYKFEAGIVTGLSYGYDEEDVSDSKHTFSYNGWSPVLFPHVSYSLYNSDSLEVRPTLGLLGSALSLSFQIVY